MKCSNCIVHVFFLPPLKISEDPILMSKSLTITILIFNSHMGLGLMRGAMLREVKAKTEHKHS